MGYGYGKKSTMPKSKAAAKKKNMKTKSGKASKKRKK